jgi:two-component system chemotaxis response regulator CheB
METQPVPIVVCSASLNPEDVANTFRALEAGAVALVAKPLGPTHPDFAANAAKFLETVVLMSEIKVVRRWARLRRVGKPVKGPERARAAEAPVRVVAVGASTGGPPVLQTILTGLPPDFPVPVLIVQHIASGFVEGLAEWLTQTTGFPVRVASQGEPLLPGRAYLAPDGHHLGIDAQHRIALDRSQPENGLRPAVSYLFRSVATQCGSRAVGVLLTGMGRDGADGLKHLHDLGAATIAQDAESSAVYGMPGEAAKLGAVSYTLSPDRIPLALIGLVATSPESAARPLER